MLCSTGIVNEIIVDTVCKIIMLPLKRRRRSLPGEELTRLVKRRLFREGALHLLETRPSRARASCFPWRRGNEHGACVHLLSQQLPRFPAVCPCRPRVEDQNGLPVTFFTLIGNRSPFHHDPYVLGWGNAIFYLNSPAAFLPRVKP